VAGDRTALSCLDIWDKVLEGRLVYKFEVPVVLAIAVERRAVGAVES
jgi:hypothetical protein